MPTAISTILGLFQVFIWTLPLDRAAKKPASNRSPRRTHSHNKIGPQASPFRFPRGPGHDARPLHACASPVLTSSRLAEF